MRRLWVVLGVALGLGASPSCQLYTAIGERPLVSGRTDDGVALDLAHEPKPIVLFFTSPHCHPCQAMYPSIAQLRTRHVAARSRFVLVEIGGDAPMERPATIGPDVELLSDSGAWADCFELRYAPHVTVVAGGVLLLDEPWTGAGMAQRIDRVLAALGD